MDSYHEEVGLNVAVASEMLAFARRLNSKFGNVVGEIEGVRHEESEGPRARRIYSFGGVIEEARQLRFDAGRHLSRVWVERWAHLHLEEEWRTDHQPGEFMKLYGAAFTNPQALSIYESFAVVSTWRYFAREDRPNIIQREYATKIWGFLLGLPDQLDPLPNGQPSARQTWRRRLIPSRRRTIEQAQNMNSDFERRMDVQRINTILGRLGWVATGLYERALH